DRSCAYLGEGHGRGRLGIDGGAVGRQLWHQGRTGVFVSGHHEEWRVRHRAGTVDRRDQSQAHGSVGAGAARGARRGEGPAVKEGCDPSNKKGRKRSLPAFFSTRVRHQGRGISRNQNLRSTDTVHVRGSPGTPVTTPSWPVDTSLFDMK